MMVSSHFSGSTLLYLVRDLINVLLYFNLRIILADFGFNLFKIF